jgi:nicotinic acid mononucleotide adenylyltransferase
MESVGLTMKVESRSGYNPEIELVRSAVYEDILAMAKVFNQPLTSYPVAEIISSLKQRLDQAAYLWNRDKINPHVNIRTSPDDPSAPSVERSLRIGIYPVAANPFHWAHLLAGLSALVRFKLDKIVYLISGSDPRKPSMISAEIRHFMGKEVLKMFAPLFGYSSIAMGSNDDGETNMFKMLALNPEQKIDAFYIVGADHCHRINPKTGGADTIQKIEGHLARNTGDFNDALHSVSIIFIERGARHHVVETCLPMAFIPEMPFAASSTMIREAFQGKRGIETLSLMPYAAYWHAIELGLYGSGYPPVIHHRQHNQPARHARSYQEITLQRCTNVLQYVS